FTAHLTVPTVSTNTTLFRSRNRQLEVLLDAVAATYTPLNLDLLLMPNDPPYIEELRARAVEGVRVLDPVPYAELVSTLNGYDLRSEEHTSELQSRENIVCRP